MAATATQALPPSSRLGRPRLIRRQETPVPDYIQVPIIIDIITLGAPTNREPKGVILESHAMKTELRISNDTTFEKLRSGAQDRATEDFMKKLLDDYKVRESWAAGDISWTFAVQHNGPRAPLAFEERSWPRVRAHLLTDVEGGGRPQLRGFVFRKASDDQFTAERPIVKRMPSARCGI